MSQKGSYEQDFKESRSLIKDYQGTKSKNKIDEQ